LARREGAELGERLKAARRVIVPPADPPRSSPRSSAHSSHRRRSRDLLRSPSQRWSRERPETGHGSRSRSLSKGRASTSRLRHAALGGVSKHHASRFRPPARLCVQPAALVYALFRRHRRGPRARSRRRSCARSRRRSRKRPEIRHDDRAARREDGHRPTRRGRGQPRRQAADAAIAAASCARPRARRGCPYATCCRGTACMRAQASAASTTASAPGSMVGRAGRAVVGAVGEATDCERAGCVWRCAGDLHRAIGGQRPRAHVASFCAIACSASSASPVGGHHSGRRRAGAAHATDVHPAATAAYAIAAAAAAAAHAGGRRACAGRDRTDGPQVVSPDSSRPRRCVAPSIDGKE
jgi:hypothetical protein